jgi:uncharacterized protein YdeI (YjbR/CyaY-like superfamily)
MDTHDVNTVVARTPAQWRAWLSENCRSETEVWLIIHHKDSGTPSVRYHEAIEQALCFGWIEACAADVTPTVLDCVSRRAPRAAPGAG